MRINGLSDLEAVFLFTILYTHENYGLSNLEAVFCHWGEGILNGNSEIAFGALYKPYVAGEGFLVVKAKYTSEILSLSDDLATAVRHGRPKAEADSPR